MTDTASHTSDDDTTFPDEDPDLIASMRNIGTKEDLENLKSLERDEETENAFIDIFSDHKDYDDDDEDDDIQSEPDGE